MKRNGFLFLLAIGALLMASSCKKDKTTEATSITGSWRISGSPNYLLFTAEGDMYKLYENNSGYHLADAYIYQYSGSQIKVQSAPSFGNDFALYNTQWSGDTLLFFDGNTNVYKLLRDRLGPQQLSDWVAGVNVVDMFTDTVQSDFITFANGRLYSFKSYTPGPRLIEYNPTTKQVSGIFPSDFMYGGIEYVNGDVWCSRSLYIYKYNLGTGSNTFQSATAGSSVFPVSLAGGNGLIYTWTTNGYKDYNVFEDSWTSTQTLYNEVTDMAFADGYLYAVRQGFIYKMNPYYKEPLQTWMLKEYDVFGIAHDGTNFWLTARNKYTREYKVIKATL